MTDAVRNCLARNLRCFGFCIEKDVLVTHGVDVLWLQFYRSHSHYETGMHGTSLLLQPFESKWNLKLIWARLFLSNKR